MLIVKLDFSNAFNALRRDAILEEVMKDVPDLYRFVHAAYTIDPVLQYNCNTVLSCEGPQQGEPLGPLMFRITIHPLLRQLRLDLRIGYLDDLTADGRPDLVVRDVELI